MNNRFWIGVVVGAAACFLILALSACGGGGGDAPQFIPPPPIDAQKCASMTLPKNGMSAEPCPVQGQ